MSTDLKASNGAYSLPKKRKKRDYSLGDYLVWASLIIISGWILKLLFRLDPPEELATIPWIAIAFAAGGLYEKVTRLEQTVKDLTQTMQNQLERIAKLEAKPQH
jgi:hypothetical protein